MGKIICEVCGTSYGETAGQCPICGTARPGNSVPVSGGSAEQSGRGAYQHVKGGRFSKSNVRKRNKSMQDGGQSVSSKKPANKGGKNTGLVITAIFLILAILAVLVYIAINFLGPLILGDSGKPGNINKPAVSDTQPVQVPCTGIDLRTNVIELEPTGTSVPSELIQYSVLPANTTDPVTFRSEDPSVATVTDKGKVVFVSAGQTQIFITCGEFEAVCKVRCIVEETTVPETTAETTVPEKEFSLSEQTLYLYFIGDEGTIKSGEIDPVLVTWKSSNDDVATVSKGVVTQTGVGSADIQATYNGETLTCKVVCTDDLGSGTGGGITEDGGSGGTTQGGESGEATGTTYRLFNPMNPNATPEDIVIHKSRPLDLDLVDENGKPVSGSVVWSVSDEAVCTIDNRGVVTGVKIDKGDWAIVTAKYDGKEYKCKIRVWYE